MTRWSRRQFTHLARGLSPNGEAVFLSTHKDVDESGLSLKYYHQLSRNDANGPPSQEESDQVVRCRILRQLPQREALRHLRALRFALSETLDELSPDVVVSETVDSFTVDTLRLEAGQRQIPFLGLVKSFLNGYIRITSRGEHVPLRTPSTTEIESALRTLEDPDFSPTFVPVGRYLVHAAAITRWAKNLARIPYYRIRRLASADNYNDNYWASELVSRAWARPLPHLNVGDDTWRRHITTRTLPAIYVPLQFTPEATIDYWCQSIRALDYEHALVTTIRALSTSMQFVVKEHPSMLGLRHPSLYRALCDIPRVHICKTHTPSNEVISLTDGVLVWTGTAGFEAALRGKPVLRVCDPYYLRGMHPTRTMLVDPRSSPDQVAKFVSETGGSLPESAKQLLVATLLEGLLPSSATFGWAQSTPNAEQEEWAADLGRQLAECLPAIAAYQLLDVAKPRES